MRPFERLWRMPADERSLLVQSCLWVAGMTVAVQIMTTERLSRTVARLARTHRAPAPTRSSPLRVGGAVEAAGRRIPAARCLPRALAAQIMLGRLGYEPILRYGVLRDRTGKLSAHAWVVCDAQVVVGGQEAARFQAMKGVGHPR
jgi:hypothetical protein